MANRLFCVRNDGGARFCLATGLGEAVAQLGRTARYPDDAEIVEFWALHGLHDKSLVEIGQMFGVSPQTASNWRRRAGIPSRTAARLQSEAEAPAAESE